MHGVVVLGLDYYRFNALWEHVQHYEGCYEWRTLFILLIIHFPTNYLR